MKENNAKILVANPYRDDHIKLIKEFEQKLNNNLPYQTSDILMDIRKKQPQQIYFMARYNSDTVEENLYLIEDDELKSSCYIEGKKSDRKCTFTYVTPKIYQGQGFGKQMLDFAFIYATVVLEMDIVELEIAKGNQDSVKLAQSIGFEKVGEYGMSEIYAKSSKKKDKGFKTL